MMNFTFSPLTQILTNLKNSGNSLLQTLSTPEATTTYLIILMALIAALTAYILVALHVIRKNGEKVLQEGSAKNNASKNPQTETDSRFSTLTRIDKELESYVPQEDCADKPLDLLCTDFRNFAANNLGLYYDISDIRRFIAGMGVSRLMILRGMSGTGKTSLAYAAGEFFGNPSTIVPIQPMWKERSDVLGYFNEFTKRFNETTMLCKLYEAGGKDNVYVIVLDEVNISRIEYYFAEFLSLLEIPDPKKRLLDVVSDSWTDDPKRLQNGKLLLPENVWFVGTANNDDSTFAISDKVYDRAAVIDLEKKSVPFRAESGPATVVSFRNLAARFAEAKQQHTWSEESRKKLAQLDSHIANVFRISFGNRILRQLQDYVPIMKACGGTENEALDDILSRKIFRKLEQLSPSLIKSEVPALIAYLEELFGVDALPLSRDYLDRLHRSA